MPSRKRTTTPGAARPDCEALETRDLLTLALVPIAPFTTIPFSGKVGSFAAADISGGLGQLTASVDWGDQSAASPAGIVNTSSGYDVLATHTYANPGLFPLTVTVKGLNSEQILAAEPVTVTVPRLNIQAAPLAATAGSPFTGKVASFTDNTGTPASGFSATITWGKSLITTPAAVVATGPGAFDVRGTFTYTTPGPDVATVSVVRAAIATPTTTTASVPVSVNASLAATGATFTATAGRLFTGKVAGFTDGNPAAVASNYTATIAWTGAADTTQGTIVANPVGGFGVFGSNTYAKAGAFPVAVTITRTSDGAKVAATSNAVVDGALTLVPSAGLAATANRPFAVTLATVIDAQTGTNPADLSANVDWGDGTSGPASVVSVGATSPVLAVVGNHVYPDARHYTVTTTLLRNATNQVSVISTGLDVFPFNGGVDPVSSPSSFGGVTVTDHAEPRLTGQAQPGSTVRLYSRAVNGGADVLLGETQADASGRWSTVVGPIGTGLGPFFLDGVALPTNGPPTPLTVLNGGQPVRLVKPSVQPLRAGPGRGSNQIVLIVVIDNKGPDPAGLFDAGSYTVLLDQGRSAHPSAARVSPANPRRPSAARTVTLNFAPGTLPKHGATSLRVGFPGLNGPGATAVLGVGRARS